MDYAYVCQASGRRACPEEVRHGDVIILISLSSHRVRSHCLSALLSVLLWPAELVPAGAACALACCRLAAVQYNSDRFLYVWLERGLYYAYTKTNGG